MPLHLRVHLTFSRSVLKPNLSDHKCPLTHILFHSFERAYNQIRPSIRIAKICRSPKRSGSSNSASWTRSYSFILVSASELKQRRISTEPLAPKSNRFFFG